MPGHGGLHAHVQHGAAEPAGQAAPVRAALSRLWDPGYVRVFVLFCLRALLLHALTCRCTAAAEDVDEAVAAWRNVSGDCLNIWAVLKSVQRSCHVPLLQHVSSSPRHAISQRRASAGRMPCSGRRSASGRPACRCTPTSSRPSATSRLVRVHLRTCTPPCCTMRAAMRDCCLAWQG